MLDIDKIIDYTRDRMERLLHTDDVPVNTAAGTRKKSKKLRSKRTAQTRARRNNR